MKTLAAALGVVKREEDQVSNMKGLIILIDFSEVRDVHVVVVALEIFLIERSLLRKVLLESELCSHTCLIITNERALLKFGESEL